MCKNCSLFWVRLKKRNDSLKSCPDPVILVTGRSSGSEDLLTDGVVYANEAVEER